ncbi:MAG: DUF3025 domain-containing protein [Polyangiaceae bacterium]
MTPAVPRLPTLRGARSSVGFDARFYEKSPVFWPIASFAARFADRADFPEPPELDVLVSDGSLRFRPATGRPRRRPLPVDVRSLYDGRILLDGIVPTRRRSWHDYLNALVWAAFPRAKRALHAEQLGELRSAIDANAGRLPNARSRRHDALAIVDEGGVLVLRAEREVPIVFGHALFEELVILARSVVPRAILLDVEHVPEARSEQLELADSSLAARLRDRELTVRSMPVANLERVILGAPSCLMFEERSSEVS